MLKFIITSFAMLTLSFSSYAQSADPQNKGARLAVDLYAVHANIMPYKGYSNDLMATVHLKYNDWKLRPFVRYVYTDYHFLNTLPPGNTTYTDDTRKAGGIGLDYFFTDYFRARFIYEAIDFKLSNQNVNQESLGLIYNQMISLGSFVLNNYAEAFYIPRLSNDNFDNFLRVQALVPFDIYSDKLEFSNTLYPFAQVKIRANDNYVFGLSGSNMSLGLGYKFYDVLSNVSNFSLLLEGHAVVYQSSNLNGDWAQALLALQYLYN